MKKPNYYLLFDRIKIQNANAISSPITYGFPAISGFLGAIHALNRKIVSDIDIQLAGVLIASHQCDVQSFRPHNFADYSFNQSRNPIKKDGKTASIIEEGKVHLEVSLVVEVFTDSIRALQDEDEQEKLIQELTQKLMQQRIAGGSVLNISNVKLYKYADANHIINQLIPAFVLIEAKQELLDITQELQKENSEATALDALIEMATLHHEPQENNTWKTTTVKTDRGWLVPIPVGYQGISPAFEPDTLTNCRTQDYPSQYVECIYSLGKWVFPYRVKDQFDQSFWHYQTEPQQNLYLITQEQQQNSQGDLS